MQEKKVILQIRSRKFLLHMRKKQSADKRNENGSTNLATDDEIVSDGRNLNAM